ncbi:hypothetical protein DC74_1752 [Streptomyces noursei]|uniref:Uncharacterized protein n=1 Tax=Streptomyces noursei TaxID=1971 RepID=A0A059W3B0_STRNR|nr:hypothetical protein DC74_1752 [Streptomyces noursei]GCB89882.1 hypothetical protein SALB_02575 [Streptomyces noursei]
MAVVNGDPDCTPGSVQHKPVGQRRAGVRTSAGFACAVRTGTTPGRTMNNFWLYLACKGPEWRTVRSVRPTAPLLPARTATAAAPAGWGRPSSRR